MSKARGIVIDEVASKSKYFGTENLQSLHSLFSFLKNYFCKIFVKIYLFEREISSTHFFTP